MIQERMGEVKKITRYLSNVMKDWDFESIGFVGRSGAGYYLEENKYL